jgi:hypothetical protein
MKIIRYKVPIPLYLFATGEDTSLGSLFSSMEKLLEADEQRGTGNFLSRLI